MSLGISVIDPSEGTNYTGGASWTAGMPLLPSNAGLVGYDGVVGENSFGGMTYEQAMQWAPAPMTQRIDALRAGAGRSFEGLGASESFNPVFVWIGVAAAAYWLFFRQEPSYR